jgi:hypothetical protein
MHESGSEAGTSARGRHGTPPDIRPPRPLSEEEVVARDRLLRAMLDAPWSTEEGGVPAAYSEDSRCEEAAPTEFV